MLEYLQQLAWDPTAPVPDGWPQGWYGVLLLFCIPGGVGIPPGVLLGHRGGLGAIVMTVLYFASDIVLAAFFEPLLQALAFVSRRAPVVDRALRFVLRGIERTMPAGSLAGPTGVVLTGFGGGLPFGRALASAAGYGLAVSWLLTIAGDMMYYTLGMASTLWFDGLIGDPRMAALAGIAVMLVVPMLVRRFRSSA
jgi:hypothetical protein